MRAPKQLKSWWQGRRWRDDRGDTSIQMAIIFPFVLLATVAVIQASMWYYASQEKRVEQDRRITTGAPRENETDAERRAEQIPGECANQQDPPAVPAQDSPERKASFTSPNPKPSGLIRNNTK